MSDIYYWDGNSEVPQDVVNVVVESGVTTIPECTFSCRSLLRTVSFPSTLVSIGNCAFADCDSLERITISENVYYIGAGAFSMCKNLKSIYVEPSNTKYLSKNGTLYERYTSSVGRTLQPCLRLLQYAIGKEDEQLQLVSPLADSKLTEICDYAFQDSVNIKSVVFGEDVKTVGNNAFSNCTHLRKISLDTALQSIGNYTFYNCPLLSSVTIPSNVKSIGTCAFGYIETDVKVIDFSIRGYEGTESESYAEDNEFIFYSVVEIVPVTGIVKTPDVESYSVAVGKTIELGITVSPEDASDTSIIWQSSNLSIASAGQGTVTGISTGTTTVTATTFDGRYSVSWTIHVIVPIESITLDTESLQVLAGNLVRATARLSPTNTTRRAITWTSSDTDVVDILSYTNPETDSLISTCTLVPKRPGAVTITAASAADNVEGKCEIVVLSPKSTDPQIIVKGNSSSMSAGSEYEVEILLKNNPGIVGMNLRVSYDSSLLTWVSATNYQIAGSNALGASYHCNTGLNPYKLCWANDLLTENIEISSKIVTLKFRLNQTVSAAKQLPVIVYYDLSDLDIYDVTLSPVEFAVTNSTIKISNVLYGDVNGSHSVTAEDWEILTKYLASWQGVTISASNLPAADLNGDGRITHKDQVILARYVDSSKEYSESVKQKVRAGDTYILPDNIIDTSPVISITIVKNGSTVTLVAGTDYTVEGTVITFNSTTNITDTSTEATITYKHKSNWAGTAYETIPFDN